MPELYLRRAGCGTAWASARWERLTGEPPRAPQLPTRRGCRCTRGGVQAQASDNQFEFNNRVIERFGPLTLISGTGIPPASPPLPGQFTARGTVSGAAFANRLHNGNTLITDANNNRIVEVNAADAPV